MTTTESVDTFKMEGIGFNSYEFGKEIGDAYETDSPDYRTLTQNTFIDLWHKGLIYEGNRVNNYCPGCQTTVADSEIDYEEKQTLFSNLIFKVKETGENIVIGTTRPEFIFSCAIVIFNPEDDRYKKLEGKTAIVPISGHEVKIKSHTYAQIDKGTGLVMMCAFGDNTDIQFFRENNLVPNILVGIDGRMNEKASILTGLKIKEARKQILEILQEKKLITEQRQVMHRAPICERSKDDIEFIEMKEFYLKQVEFKEKMHKIADKVNFFAPESKQILTNWINSVSIDWPISRRRYYATEIPLWYCKNCREPIVPQKGKYYQPWKDDCPIKECPKCRSKEFIGEIRVFDTWFDSSISPLYILGYERHQEFYSKNSICSLRPQGKEIVRTWLYYTLLKCNLLTDNVIFHDAWIHQHITDEKGMKMSKSKGNVIDPKLVLDRYCAEALRLWAAVEGDLTKIDFRCSYERIEGAGKTIAKLWNASKFISLFENAKDAKVIIETDRWILNEINNLIEETDNSYANYDFHTPATKLRHFLWETLASHYIELVKARAYNGEGKFTKEEQESALYTLHKTLQIMLKLFAPINPMITYKIYDELYHEDIHFTEFPKKENISSDMDTQLISKTNSDIWKAKKDSNKSLKDEIDTFEIDKRLKLLEKDLVAAHNIKKIVWM